MTALLASLQSALTAIDVELDELHARREQLLSVRLELGRVIESLASPAPLGDAAPASPPAGPAEASRPVHAGQGAAPGTPKRLKTNTAPSKPPAAQTGPGRGRKGTPKARGPVRPCPNGCGYETDWVPAMRQHLKKCPGPAPAKPGLALAKIEATEVAHASVEDRAKATAAHAGALLEPKRSMTPDEFTPALRRTRPAALPDGKVLACTEKGCGHEAGAVRDLIHHTITEHNREPYAEEKWPVQPQGQAS